MTSTEMVRWFSWSKTKTNHADPLRVGNWPGAAPARPAFVGQQSLPVYQLPYAGQVGFGFLVVSKNPRIPSFFVFLFL